MTAETKICQFCQSEFLRKNERTAKQWAEQRFCSRACGVRAVNVCDARAQARSDGVSKYKTGKPCRNGHTAERYTHNGMCVECSKEHGQNYELSPDQVAQAKISTRKSYLKNRNKVLARTKARRESGYNREYYEKNKEKVIAGVKLWIKDNKERRNAYRQKRRANGVGTVLPGDIVRIEKAQGCKCAVCRTDLKKSGKHIDHIIPLAKGGANIPSNVQLLCPTCNRSKGSKDPIDFMQSLGRLL